MTDVPVSDLRSAPRFILDPPLEGSFRGEPVRIFNIGEEGVQIEVKSRVERAEYGELRFSLPTSPRVLRVYGRVKWCRPARGGGPAYSWPFRCGLAIEGIHTLTLDSLAQLIELELAKLDRNSLERKRELLQKTALNLDPDLPRSEQTPIISTLSALVEATRSASSELSRNPAAISRLAEAGRRNLQAESGEALAYEDEILAVWEYLHRCAPPRMIALAFDIDSGS